MTSQADNSPKKPLWIPPPERAATSRMSAFIKFVNEREATNFTSYPELYKWSVDQPQAFWAAIWDYGEIRHSRTYDRVVNDITKMPGAWWFPGAKLNFAENLLRYRDDREALVFRGEDGSRKSMTYSALYDNVAKLSSALKKLGVGPKDRVAGYVANIPETIVSMLSATSLGAIWTSCSPDFGWKGALDRFGQTKPRVLIAVDGYRYNGKSFSIIDRIAELKNRIDAIEQVIIIPFLEENPDISSIDGAKLLPNVIASQSADEIDFYQGDSDHPVYILYSSGTTNVPKCITHGAGGALVQHYKELALHTNVDRNTSIFYFTSCGWMMWNWLVSNLMLGARIILFDGSPFYPGPEILWKIASEEKVEVFGTSAKYLDALEASGLKPMESFDLEPMRVLCSTGSPLSAKSFQYVYRDIKKDVQLSSIAGGTDIISCFVLGNPLLPVYEEQIQCIGLGMKVEAFGEDGKPVKEGKGELVCTLPAPSMPIYFWNDPEMKKYKEAYFDVYPGIWRHGDYIEITKEGGVAMFGRSDATLNPGGVRIGTAEIYKPLSEIPEIEDSLVVGQRWDNDERVVLFVVMSENKKLDDELIGRIKKKIRLNASPRHVPAKVIQVPAVPHTLTGKKVELAVRKILHGETISNRTALANPEILDFYKDLPELKK